MIASPNAILLFCCIFIDLKLQQKNQWFFDFFRFFVGFFTKYSSSWMVFKKFIYSHKKFVRLSDCESCEAIWAEKMQQDTEEITQSSVNYSLHLMNGGRLIKNSRRKSVHLCAMYYVFKWMKTLFKTISSFVSTPFFLIIFLFCLYFCLLSHLIIRCFVKYLIATSVSIFCAEFNSLKFGLTYFHHRQVNKSKCKPSKCFIN